MAKNRFKRGALALLFVLFLAVSSLIFSSAHEAFAAGCVKTERQVMGKKKTKKKKVKKAKKAKKPKKKLGKKSKKKPNKKPKKKVKKTNSKAKKSGKGKYKNEDVRPLFGDGSDFSFTINGDTVEGHYDADGSLRLIQLLNDYRAKKGRKPLSASKSLTKAAMIRSREITVVFDHRRPDGSMCFTASKDMDGENIAGGYLTVDAMMDAWIHSPGHNANMLDKSFNRVGISVLAVKSQYGFYIYFASQNFGR